MNSVEMLLLTNQMLIFRSLELLLREHTVTGRPSDVDMMIALLKDAEKGIKSYIELSKL